MTIAPTVSMRTALTALYLVGLTSGASAFFPATASAGRLQQCAREGDICRLPYPAEVVFGVDGRTTSRFFDREAVPCTTRVFGDPAPGRKKGCYIAMRDRGQPDGGYDEPRRESWAVCANEGEFCDFYGRKVVRFGARGQFTQDVFRNGVQCDTDSFGDPAPRTKKRCYIRQ